MATHTTTFPVEMVGGWHELVSTHGVMESRARRYPAGGAEDPLSWKEQILGFSRGQDRKDWRTIVQ